MEDYDVVYVDKADEFIAKLSTRSWKRVAAMARYSSDEPSFANPLRQYANRDPDASIELVVWHDNGKEIPPQTAVLGTTALVVWNRALSTTAAYRFEKKHSDKQSARTVSGLLFPDFADVQLQDSMILGRVIEVAAPGKDYKIRRIPPSPQPKLEDQWTCLSDLSRDLLLCNIRRRHGLFQCTGLYGERGAKPNPGEFLKCSNRVNEAYVNRVGSEFFDFELCIKVSFLKKEKQKD